MTHGLLDTLGTQERKEGLLLSRSWLCLANRVWEFSIENNKKVLIIPHYHVDQIQYGFAAYKREHKMVVRMISLLSTGVVSRHMVFDSNFRVTKIQM